MYCKKIQPWVRRTLKLVFTHAKSNLPFLNLSERFSKMKLLTANFVTCAVKACKTSQNSYPLHFQNAELEQSDIEYNPSFIRNILPRIDWEALKITATEVWIYCSTNSRVCFLLSWRDTFSNKNHIFKTCDSEPGPKIVLFHLETKVRQVSAAHIP